MAANVCIEDFQNNAANSFSRENSRGNGVVSNDQKLYSSSERTSNAGSSQRRLFYMPAASYAQMDEDTENEIISQVGDIGDRELSGRGSQRMSLRFSVDRVIFPAPEQLLDSSESRSRDSFKSNAVHPVRSSMSGTISPVCTDLTLLEKQEGQKKLPPSLEYVACLVYLAFFAIPGVLSRHLLREFFGPEVAAVTSYNGILYLGLPSNMAGSFLMGWWGIVFRSDISRVSDQLLIGLTTGYLGSLTAFSGWIQQMLDLSVRGHWGFATIGLVIGLFLSSYSYNFGIETARGFKWLLHKPRTGSSTSKLGPTHFKRHLIVVVVLACFWGGLWAAFGVLEKKDFNKGGNRAQLWLACFLGPFGVWARWWLAALNGRGLGKSGSLRWIPFGTLIANVSAVSVMAALAVLIKSVDTKNCKTVATGIQFGFAGCLSTVPAFIAEFNAMRQSSKPWRAYAYAIIMIGMSFGLGTLIYSLPVWLKGYQ